MTNEKSYLGDESEDEMRRHRITPKMQAPTSAHAGRIVHIMIMAGNNVPADHTRCNEFIILNDCYVDKPRPEATIQCYFSRPPLCPTVLRAYATCEILHFHPDSWLRRGKLAPRHHPSSLFLIFFAILTSRSIGISYPVCSRASIKLRSRQLSGRS